MQAKSLKMRELLYGTASQFGEESQGRHFFSTGIGFNNLVRAEKTELIIGRFRM
jgi:hypothetical protein